jgi:excisionase family DNA binding protein
MPRPSTVSGERSRHPIGASEGDRLTVRSERVSAKDAARYIGISVPNLWRLTRTRQVAHTRVGRRVVFDTRDLDSFLRARRVEARPDSP